jgi:Concanavalin A-like lectin/glucanases superfamily
MASAALLAFACSVYEAPSASLDPDDSLAGSAGSGATAGVAATTSAGTGTTTAGAGSGSGGTSSAGAGSSAGNPSGTGGGTGGSPVIDPPSGGEGGAPAVQDDCPNDPNKLAPGACGCGIPDAPGTTHADCQTLKGLLVHRYDFEGSGTAVKDRIGTAHGVVARGSTLSKLDGKGVVLLGGGDVGAYVDLPNGIVSSLTNATFEAWVTWGGGTSWQRIFDFGDSTATVPENNQLDGKTYLFLTPKSGFGTALLGYSPAGVTQELDVKAPTALAQTLTQVVGVADDAGNVLTLYVNGAKAAEQPWTATLSSINDVNVWLGRSQYKNDSELNAVYHEFRIYKAALNAAQVSSAFNAGPDPTFLAY